jgi:DNA-binding HxlR family transcriptional regulator
LRVISGRWKVLVLHYLLAETIRFNELHRKLGGISPRTLAKQLRELERDGILRRKAFAEIPPRVEYSLSPLGKSLEPILRAMHAWGESFAHRLPEAEK